MADIEMDNLGEREEEGQQQEQVQEETNLEDDGDN